MEVPRRAVLDCQKVKPSRTACYTHFENDDTDQIHDETARQSRWAFGIGLSIALPSSDSNPRRLRRKVGAFWFLRRFWPVAKLERHVTVTHAMRRFESCPASQFSRRCNGSLVQ